jgi:hypothetical protein
MRHLRETVRDRLDKCGGVKNQIGDLRVGAAHLPSALAAPSIQVTEPAWQNITLERSPSDLWVSSFRLDPSRFGGPLEPLVLFPHAVIATL